MESGDARREEHARRLAEPLPAGSPAGARRRCAPCAVHAQLPRMLQGRRRRSRSRSDQLDAVRAFATPTASARRSRRCTRQRPTACSTAPGARRSRPSKMLQGAPTPALPAGQRRRVPARTRSAQALQADRAAHQGRRRARGRVRRYRRLGHARQPGARNGQLADAPRRLRARPRRALTATSATAWRTRSC